MENRQFVDEIPSKPPFVGAMFDYRRGHQQINRSRSIPNFELYCNFSLRPLPCDVQNIHTNDWFTKETHTHTLDKNGSFQWSGKNMWELNPSNKPTRPHTHTHTKHWLCTCRVPSSLVKRRPFLRNAVAGCGNSTVMAMATSYNWFWPLRSGIITH